ncbi:MAG: PhzF family phenazine biosynthesis protein [Pseudorhodobacter sp.]|nr:MAG: PhzF family phenazine biosynthesis protein [Pseudorhodobacter sp.]
MCRPRPRNSCAIRWCSKVREAGYLVYDVFTDTRFGGNQLAVFPDATGLPEDRLQAIAAEFNFSEVTFVYPPADPAHSARVRIFTPTVEVPFAGHPTIGTAIALAGLGRGADLVLELGVGPIPCKVGPHGAEFTTPVPLQIIAHPPVSLIAAALGLPESSIVTTTHAPVQASLGLAFVLVELDARATLARAAPVVEVLKKAAEAYPAGLDFAIFCYVRQGEAVDARMFAPLDNMPEDPATGSASATLAALLASLPGGPQRLAITQGQDMGRLSQIAVSVGPDGVTVRGQAVKVMAGTLYL